MSVSLRRVIDRNTYGGRAEQPFGFADAAGQRAIGVGEPRALRVLAREQEPSADGLAEQVGVGRAAPGGMCVYAPRSMGQLPMS